MCRRHRIRQPNDCKDCYFEQYMYTRRALAVAGPAPVDPMRSAPSALETALILAVIESHQKDHDEIDGGISHVCGGSWKGAHCRQYICQQIEKYKSVGRFSKGMCLI